MPNLSVYTNIPPGTPVVITYRVQVKTNMPQWVRDGLNSVTQAGILDSITPDQLVMHDPHTSPQPIILPKEYVNSIAPIHPERDASREFRG